MSALIPSELKYNIILGSKSPRRQELLEEAGFQFHVIKRDIDESVPEKMAVNSVPEHLALQKAENLRDLIENETLIITADTLVILNDQILGKPTDVGEAKEMLNALSGQSHFVITGVCLKTESQTKSFSESTEVVFNELSQEIIDHYIEHYKPFDKAGSYGIQEWIGLVGVKEVRGCFFNVIGLPVPRLILEMKDL